MSRVNAGRTITHHWAISNVGLPFATDAEPSREHPAHLNTKQDPHNVPFVNIVASSKSSSRYSHRHRHRHRLIVVCRS